VSRPSVGKVQPVVAGPVRQQAIGRLIVETGGPGFVDLTRAVSEYVSASGVHDGLASIFCRHTSASLTIQENADPDVQADLATALERLAPRDAPYRHGIEGPDDMPAHIRTMLTGSSLAIPVLARRLALGEWQGIYLVEHRDRPHRRELTINLYGT
jgi:secondary thiamine-phosphate synthase enzyme